MDHPSDLWYNRNGRALTVEERSVIAKRKGQCPICGILTHQGRLRKQPLNNDDVHGGKCIRCNPEAVPEEIRQAWEQRQKRPPTFRATAHAVTAAVRYAQQGERHRAAQQQPAQPTAAVIESPLRISRPTVSTAASLHHSLSSSHSSLSEPFQAESPLTLQPQLSPLRALSDPSLSMTKPRPATTTPIRSRWRSILEALQNGNATDDPEPPVTGDLLVALQQEDLLSPSRLLAILHQIRNRLTVDQVHEYLARIQPLRPLLRDTTHEGFLTVLVATLWRVAALTKDHTLVDDGWVCAMVRLLQQQQGRSSQSVVESTLGALACIMEPSIEARHAMVQAAGIEAVVECLHRHGEASPQVLVAAARCIIALLDHDQGEGAAMVEKHVTLLLGCQAPTVLLAAMAQHPLSIGAQQWAFQAWTLFYQQSDRVAKASLLQEMAKNEGFRTLARQLLQQEEPPLDLNIYVWDFLSLLLEEASNDLLLSSVVDGLGLVVRRLTTDSDHVCAVESALTLIGIVASRSSRARPLLLEASAMEVISKSMDQCRNDYVAEVGEWVLWQLSQDTSRISLEQARQALAVVGEAVNAHKGYSVDLLLAACGVVANLVLVPGLVREDVPLHAVTKALAFSSEHSELRLEAIRALCMVCRCTTDLSLENEGVLRLSLLLELLSDPSCAIRTELFLALTAVALRSDRMRETMLSSGALGSTNVCLQARDNVELVSLALDFVAALVAFDDGRSVDLPEDIARTVMSLLGASEAVVRVKARQTMRAVALAAKKLPESQQLLESLVASITAADKTEKERQDACTVLWAILCKHSVKDRRLLSLLFRGLVDLLPKCKADDGMANVTGALVCVTRNMAQNPIAMSVEDADMVVSSIYKCMEATVRNIATFALLLEACYYLCHVHDDAMIQCGVIVAAIDTMAEFESEAVLQERGCAILALLSSAENLQVILSITETEGIDVLVNALASYPDHQRVQWQACQALSHLCIDPEIRVSIATQGGLHLIAMAMDANRHNLPLTTSACAALLHLTSDANAADSHLVEAVVVALRAHPTHAKLQETALGILHNIAGQNRAMAQLVSDAGGVSTIIDALREFVGVPAVLEHALAALSHLVMLEDNPHAIVENDGIIGILNGMLACIECDRVLQHGCASLAALARRATHRNLLWRAGAMDVMVYSMWAHLSSEPLLMQACQAMAALATPDEHLSESHVQALVLAMQRFGHAAVIQQFGCSALRNSLPSAENASVMRAMAGPLASVLTRAAERYPEQCSEPARLVRFVI